MPSRSLFFLVACLVALLVPAGARAQQPAPSFELDGSQLKLPSPVAFETGTDKLAASSTPALEHVKAYLEAKSYVTLMRIESHTSSDGAAAANQALSEKRALAAARWLVAHGVDCKRLLPVGFGANKPVADGSTPEGKAQNTRTVFVNAELRGRAIGGMPVDGGGKVAGDPCAKK